MSTTTTRIDITAKDSTAGAFNSAERNLSSLASTALKTTAGLASIGITIAGVVDAVRGIAQATIQFQQFTNTLQVGTGSAKGAQEALAFVREESHRLGLDLASSAEQFAKLSAASKGTALEGKATKDIFTAISQAATAMGLSAEQTSGSLLAIQQIISKGTVSAEELRGQLGERLPGAFQIAARAIGVTTAELDKMLRAGKVTAEQMLPALSVELNKTFGAQAEQAAQGLTAQMNRMNTALFDLKIAIGESGLINFLSSGIELATKLANAMAGAFGGGRKLSAVDQQSSLVKSLEKELESLNNLSHVPVIGDLLFSKRDADLLKFRLETATEDLLRMKEKLSQQTVTVSSISPEDDKKLQEIMERGAKTAEKFADPLKKLKEQQAQFKEELDKGAISLEVYNRAMKQTQDAYNRTNVKSAQKAVSDLNKEQNKALRVQSEYIKLLEIERKQRQDLIKPYQESVKQASQSVDQMEAQIGALKLVRDRQISLKEAVELTTIARLQENKVSATDPRIIKEIESEIVARRKLINLTSEYDQLESQTRRTTDQVTQFWIQAARNIQTSLSNSIFDFFNDGLDGMIRSVKNAVLRIASEFAALKISQSIGLDAMFSVGGGVGGTGGAANALNLASIGTNLASGLKSNFGLNSLIGGGLSRVGGSGLIGSFGAGMSGGAQAAAFIGAESATAGAGMAASMGATFAGVAGPLMAGMLVTEGLKALAGDKRLGGGFGKAMNAVGDIPVLGSLIPIIPILNGLFGRGPYKFRQQSLQGEINKDGFEGDFSNVFRAKGGLLRSNGHKSFTEQLSAEQEDLFDTTLKSFFKSSHQFAENLGLSTSLVDNFTTQVQIKSEKGKTVTEEAIAEMLSGVGDQLAKTVFPTIETFRKGGETSIAALQRLNAEFEGLEAGAMNLGASVAYAKQVVGSMSIEARSAFVEQAGGLERINQLTSAFFDTFLSDSEKLNLRTEQLNNALTDLGLSTGITSDQIKGLIQSTDTANSLRIALLELAPAFLQVRNSVDQLRNNVDQTILSLAREFAPEEVVGIQFNMANEAMKKLGLSADLSKDKVTELLKAFVKSGGLFTDVADDVIKAAGLYLNYQKSLESSETSLIGVRQELLNSYSKERGELESTIDKFKNISATLRDFKNSLVLGQLSPLTPAQKLEEARTQFNRTRSAADKGDERALQDLPRVAQEFLQASQTYNASSGAYISDFNLVKQVLDKASKAALTQADSAKLQLDHLKSTVDYLFDIKDEAKTTNQLLKDLLTATLNGKGNSSISTKDIQDFLKANPNMSADQIANAATKYGVSKDQLVSAGISSPAINKYTGGATVSDKQILDFVNSGATPMQIYQAAVANGVSSTRLSQVTGISMADINKFVKDNKLQSFAKGTDYIEKSGIVMAHRGEAIVPSSTTEEIKKLREELSKLRQEQNQQTGDMMKVTDISNQRNAQMIAEAFAQIETRKQFTERNRVRLA